MSELKTSAPTMIDDDSDSGDVVSLSTLARAVWLMAKILVPLIIGAVVVGIVFFDFQLAVFASFMGFCLMLFIALPLVLAIYEDEVIEGGGHD